MTSICKMKILLVRIAVATIVLAKTGTARPLTDKELRDLEEFASTVEIWEKCVDGLEIIKRVTGFKSEKEGESFPAEMIPRIKMLLKVVYIFNEDLKTAYRKHLQEAESFELPEKFRGWRKSLAETIEVVSKEIYAIAENLESDLYNPSSIERVKKGLKKLWYKNVGVSVLLRQSQVNFDVRFFEMVAQYIKEND